MLCSVSIAEILVVHLVYSSTYILFLSINKQWGRSYKCLLDIFVLVEQKQVDQNKVSFNGAKENHQQLYDLNTKKTFI